jgi:hypothetical protein
MNTFRFLFKKASHQEGFTRSRGGISPQRTRRAPDRIPITLEHAKLVIPGERAAHKAAPKCQPAQWWDRFMGGARGKGAQVRATQRIFVMSQAPGSPSLASLAGDDISNSISQDTAVRINAALLARYFRISLRALRALCGKFSFSATLRVNSCRQNLPSVPNVSSRMSTGAAFSLVLLCAASCAVGPDF